MNTKKIAFVMSVFLALALAVSGCDESLATSSPTPTPVRIEKIVTPEPTTEPPATYTPIPPAAKLQPAPKSVEFRLGQTLTFKYLRDNTRIWLSFVEYSSVTYASGYVDLDVVIQVSSNTGARDFRWQPFCHSCMVSHLTNSWDDEAIVRHYPPSADWIWEADDTIRFKVYFGEEVMRIEYDSPQVEVVND